MNLDIKKTFPGTTIPNKYSLVDWAKFNCLSRATFNNHYHLLAQYGFIQTFKPTATSKIAFTIVLPFPSVQEIEEVEEPNEEVEEEEEEDIDDADDELNYDKPLKKL